MKEEGYWVQYWIMRGQTDKPTKITYNFIKYKHGYTDEDKKDKDMWRKQAERWADDNGGWSANSFRYGFKFENPPQEWFKNKVEGLESSLEFYKDWLEE